MALVTVTQPDGKRVNVDESEVRPDDVVATEAGDNPVLAAANKGISALTFGLSDFAVEPENQQYVKNLRRENPVASEIGEVGGEIVQGLLVPEVKALGLAGNLALQGGLSGLGSQISEAALNNRPINTELLAADVFARATTGLVLGKGAQVTGKLVTKMAGKAGELAASERVISAAGNIRKSVLKKSLKLNDELFKYGDDAGFFASTSHEGVAAMAQEAERKAVHKATEQLDKWVEILPDYKPLRERWAELAIETGPAAKKEMQEIEQLFKQGLDDVSGNTRVSTAKPRGGVAEPFQEVPKRKPGSKYQDVNGGLGGDKTAAGRGQKVVEEVAQEKVAPKFSFEGFSEELFNAKAIKEKAVSASESSKFDLGGSIKDAIYPGIFAGPKAVAGMVGKDFAKSVASNRGGYLAGKALQKIQEGQILPNVFKGFQARVEGMLATAPGLLGPFATVLGHAAAEGAESLMAAHSALVQSSQGPEYLSRLGMRAESPEETKAYGAKLAMLEALESQKREFDISVDKATRSFFKGDSFEGAPRVTNLSTKDFASKIKTLEQALRDPSSLAVHVPEDVMQGAPGLMVGAGQQALMATQFLVDRAPKPNDLWKPAALRTPFTPGATEIAKWQRFASAVENPRAAVVDIARGKASPEAIETVKTLYPALFTEVQNKVMAQLSALQKPLPYNKKQALASIFGPQILGISPEVGMYLQAVHQAARPPPGMEQGPSQDGRQMVNSNKNLQTQTDRIANR